MKETTDHGVSTFALDVYWASDRPADGPLEAHLTECARCRAYLRELDDCSGAPARPSLRKPTRSMLRGRRWAMGAGALALAAGLLLVVRGRHASTDDYVGVKGTPAVQMLVHRGAETRLWDGHSPVQPGDALALRVACEGLTRATVLSPGPAGWARLSEAPCPRDGDRPLPFTLRVDAEPGDEQLAVVLSREPMADATLEAAARTLRRDADVWVVRFTLPKITETGR
jgi:hypothetical protein